MLAIWDRRRIAERGGRQLVSEARRASADPVATRAADTDADADASTVAAATVHSLGGHRSLEGRGLRQGHVRADRGCALGRQAEVAELQPVRGAQGDAAARSERREGKAQGSSTRRAAPGPVRICRHVTLPDWAYCLLIWPKK